MKRISQKTLNKFINQIAFRRGIKYYSKIDNSYLTRVGMEKSLKFLLRFDITEFIQNTNNNPDHTANIGFCPKEQKWYGWSHRAIFGFGIGSIAKEGDCVCSSGWTDEYLKDHPEADRSLPAGFTAKTLNDAKRMAIAFADSVA